MKEGTIRAILDFADSDDVLSEAAHSAMHEFFEISEKDCPIDDRPEEEHAHFVEWVVFDYRLPMGKTLLETYIERNPDNLNGDELRTYRDLLTNEYGLWETVAIDLGRGLKLRNIQTGQIFDVRERSGTFSLRKGNLFYGRVGLVDGHWELVSGATQVWDVRLAPSARKHWQGMKGRFSPKHAWQLSAEKPDERTEPLLMVDLETARKDLAKMLTKYDLRKYVDVPRIEEWLSDDKIAMKFIPSSLLVGLLADDVPYKKAMNEIIEAVGNLSRALPLATLKGKSPQEAFREREERGAKPDFVVSVTQLGDNSWNEVYQEAIGQIQEYDFWNALRSIQKAFKCLLEAKTTIYDVFRLYGNLATCYFAIGDKTAGVRAMETALELNPNYDFARGLKQNYSKNHYKDAFIGRDLAKFLRRRLRPKDYASLYYKFIKPYGINFATVHLTTTPHVIIGSEGVSRIGRNEPCYCGSGKKFKKCHGG